MKRGPDGTRINLDRVDEAFTLARAAGDLAHAAVTLATPTNTDTQLDIAHTVVITASTIQDIAHALISDYYDDKAATEAATNATTSPTSAHDNEAPS